MNQSEFVLIFENGAKKKGYCFDRDELSGNYKDQYLQEAWEIFSLLDLAELYKSQN